MYTNWPARSEGKRKERKYLWLQTDLFKCDFKATGHAAFFFDRIGTFPVDASNSRPFLLFPPLSRERENRLLSDDGQSGERRTDVNDRDVMIAWKCRRLSWIHWLVLRTTLTWTRSVEMEHYRFVDADDHAFYGPPSLGRTKRSSRVYVWIDDKFSGGSRHSTKP